MFKKPAKVEHWDDERDIGNSLIVTLKRGFDTVREARTEVKNSKPCACQDCTE